MIFFLRFMILSWGEEHYLVSSPKLSFSLRIRIQTFLEMLDPDPYI